jgi:hypothetical protein
MLRDFLHLGGMITWDNSRQYRRYGATKFYTVLWIARQRDKFSRSSHKPFFLIYSSAGV